VGDLYVCHATVINDDSTLQIRGTHATGKSNADVEGLNYESQPLTEIPEELKNFYPNLKALIINHSNVSRVSAKNLQFPKLQLLSIYYNKLTSLDGNLFVNNPKLIFISLDGNQIKHVGHDLLTDLNNLNLVFLFNNPCVNQEAITHEAIQSINRQLPKICPPKCSSSCRDEIMEIIEMQEEKTSKAVQTVKDENR
jgi:hypothetical protein